MDLQEFLNLLRVILPLLIPIYLIQFGLVVYALIDLRKRKEIQGPRWLWVVGLIVFSFGIPSGFIVSLAYLLWGRKGDLDDTN
jgi:hypothetical protein